MFCKAAFGPLFLFPTFSRIKTSMFHKFDFMAKYLIFILLISTFAFSQGKTKVVSKETTTEKFNWNNYKHLVSDAKTSSKNDKRFVVGTKKIRITTSTDRIIVDVSHTDSQYSTQKAYNAKTRLLMGTSQQFSNMNIGVAKEYDSKGRLQYEWRFDKFYPFTLEQFIAKMKKMGIDITKKPDLYSANRFIDKGNPPMYDLIIRETPGADKIRYIRIDGNTGATISDKITYMEE